MCEINPCFDRGFFYVLQYIYAINFTFIYKCAMSIKYQQKAAAYPLPLKDIKKLFLATSQSYSVHSFRDRCLLKTLFWAGLRREEVTKLDVRDIDFERKRIKVNGKGGKVRIVPIIDEEFLSDLNHWIGKSAEGLVFGLYGKPLSLRAINYITQRAGERAGVKNPNPRLSHINPHIFRHSIARYLKSKGFSAALNELRKKLSTDIYLIPVRLEECEVPKEHAFRSFHWIDLYKPRGFKKLTQALREGLDRLGLIQKITLRSTPIDSIGYNDVDQMLQQRGFFDREENPAGPGIKHQYELSQKAGKQVVIDHGTGLTWQQAGSSEAGLKQAHNYIRELNRDNHAGYTDWRLPTLEEAMSLMEPRVNEHALFINPLFDNKQNCIWTADKESASRAWGVDFGHGGYDGLDSAISFYVRAVR